MNKKIVGASIGNCVHVAGVIHFLQIAESEGYSTKFLGPAVNINKLLDYVEKEKPDIVGISYRLTKENVIPLLDILDKKRKELDYDPIWVFGGTKPVADIAHEYDIFSYVSDGYDDVNDLIKFLRGKDEVFEDSNFSNSIIDRINYSYPYPLLRHHFGLPNLEDTINGVETIAKSKILDVISLGTDQNTQQYFFNQSNMKSEFNGAGGVPIRTAKDFRKIKAASLVGNYPLMRCYSGTADVIKYAEMLVDTIDNAWTAVPLFWYNELDGRGSRSIESSIKDAQELIKWHAKRDVPVEINDPHHWGLRDSHDVIPIVVSYIAAYNAKKLGVKNYISQYMFNNHTGMSMMMDLAKISAMVDIVESLEDDDFKVYKEARAGLSLLSPDLDIAKGQLVASTFLQMEIKPHIIHVVGYCEADHAASADDIIESCKIVKGVIKQTLQESFSIIDNLEIQRRKKELLNEAKILIDFIYQEYKDYDDPLINSFVLADIVKKGYLDAPHILKEGKFKGDLRTTIVNGKCIAVDEDNEPINEITRIRKLKEKNK